MKAVHCRCISSLPIALLLVGLAANVPSATAAPDEKGGNKGSPGTLQVQVDVPPSWRPMFEDEIARSFVGRVRDVFRREGYPGEIKYVSDYDTPDQGCCLLTINLVEWRAHLGPNIECTFTANLQTDQTTRNLGIFTDYALRWMHGPGRFGLADTFGSAAEGALRQLYNRLAKTELVPGLRQRGS